jgi:ABC-type nitrate/sulfonate/bicarbonate transport system substrate-binding protein
VTPTRTIRSTRRRVVAVAAAAALAAVAASCGGGGSGATKSGAGGPAQGDTLRIALDYTQNVDYLGIYAAITNGYFKAEHVKAVIVPYSGVPAETLLEEHKTDLGLTYPPNIPAYRAADPPLDYEAVAGLSQVNTINIAVLASSRYHHVGQLSGTLYGGFGVPSDKPIIEDVFRRAGVAHPVYREVNLGDQAYQALADHRVAYSITFGGIDDVTAELSGVRLRQFPIKRYLPGAFTFPDDAFVALDSEVKGHPGLLRRGLHALAQGYEFAAHHPAAAEAILIRDNPTALDGSKNIIRATGNATAPTLLTKSGTWGQMDAADFTGITRIQVAGGLIKASKAPPPSADFTDSLLPTEPLIR